mgnify:CR=1 FL=1
MKDPIAAKFSKKTASFSAPPFTRRVVLKLVVHHHQKTAGNVTTLGTLSLVLRQFRVTVGGVFMQLLQKEIPKVLITV